MLALIVVACGGDDDDGVATGDGPTASSAAVAAADTATPAATPTPRPTVDPDERQLRRLFAGWKTDPTTLTVPPNEITQGCFTGRDCIPAIDAAGAVEIPGPGLTAVFLPVSEATFEANVPVAYLTVEGHTRGYPLSIMTFHEIVNDEINGVPVAATFCPLCNTALAFDRRAGGRILDFGVSGNLRNSDLIMFDRQTESWWQQFTGEAIAGKFAGTELVTIAMSILSFEDFANAFPEADIMGPPQGGYGSRYGVNPYAYYDRPGSRPFLFNGDLDDRLDALDRVVGLEFEDDTMAVPFSELSTAGVANVAVGGRAIAVLWAPGTSSALDSPSIAAGRDIGAAIAYDAVVDGQRLTFEVIEPGLYIDLETGATWDLTGLATEGPLARTRLAVAQHANHFWFAWAAFYPETTVWEAVAA